MIMAHAGPKEAVDAPEVSVIVIFKDAEAFLDEAIESVRSQTFGEWELLLVDDGSSDGSTAIARRWVRRDAERIRYLEHPGHANRGMSATRNLGVSRARGDVVAFLDADDVLLPTALEQGVSLLRSHPQLGMVYGPLEYWYGWSGNAEDVKRDFVHPPGVSAERVYDPPSLISVFVRNMGFAPAGLLFRRTLFDEVGGFDESFRDLYEDQVFATKVCVAAPVYVSGRSWYRYRQHAKACCVTAQREGHIDAARIRFLQWSLEYLERRGLHGSDAWRVAREELALATANNRRRVRRRRLRGAGQRLAGRLRLRETTRE
jgi:glycosyltransferase involved in cell wall biosynthesis